MAPQLVSALWTGTRLRVSYSEEMDKDATFLATGSYIILEGVGSVGVSVVSVTSGPGTYPTYVDLEISPNFTIGLLNYTLTVNSSIKGRSGLVIDPLYSLIIFDGNASRATLSISSFASNLTILRLLYSIPVKQVSPSNSDDALNVSNYSINGGVMVDSIKSVNSYCVELSVSNQELDTTYILTVTNVQDISNNVVA